MGIEPIIKNNDTLAALARKKKLIRLDREGLEGLTDVCLATQICHGQQINKAASPSAFNGFSRHVHNKKFRPRFHLSTINILHCIISRKPIKISLLTRNQWHYETYISRLPSFFFSRRK